MSIDEIGPIVEARRKALAEAFDSALKICRLLDQMVQADPSDKALAAQHRHALVTALSLGAALDYTAQLVLELAKPL